MESLRIKKALKDFSLEYIMALTAREIDFCRAFLQSRGCKDWRYRVADEMCLSVKTVDTHKNRAFLELGVQSQTELMHTLLTTNEWQFTDWELTKFGFK